MKFWGVGMLERNGRLILVMIFGISCDIMLWLVVNGWFLIWFKVGFSWRMLKVESMGIILIFGIGSCENCCSGLILVKVV